MKKIACVILIVVLQGTIGIAAEMALEVQPAVRVSFTSAEGKSYQVLATTNLNQTNFVPVGQPLNGSGGRITVFYDTQQDEKVFFRVEEHITITGQAEATAVVTSGFVTGINVTDGGIGYSELDPPTVTVSDPNGGGARAVAVVSNGRVTAVNVVNAGFGYSASPAVAISPPPQPMSLEGLTRIVRNLGVGVNGHSIGPFDDKRKQVSGLQLSGFNLRYWAAQEMAFSRCNLNETDLKNAAITSCDFMSCNFDRALVGGTFTQCYFDNVTFRDAELLYASFMDCEFTNTTMNGVTLVGCQFSAWSDRGADASQVSDLLSGASLIIGVRLPNDGYLNRGSTVGLDIGSDIRLNSANLAGVNFSNAKLLSWQFISSDLTGCDFSGADLVGANLARANLSGCKFQNADLTDAVFSNATNFDTNAFSGATFSNTQMPDTSFFSGTLP